MEGRETVLQPSSDWIGIYKIGKRTDSQAIRPDDGTTIWVKPCLILYFDIQLTAKPPFKYIYQSVQCQVISSVYGKLENYLLSIITFFISRLNTLVQMASELLNKTIFAPS